MQTYTEWDVEQALVIVSGLKARAQNLQHSWDTQQPLQAFRKVGSGHAFLGTWAGGFLIHWLQDPQEWNERGWGILSPTAQAGILGWDGSSTPFNVCLGAVGSNVAAEDGLRTDSWRLMLDAGWGCSSCFFSVSLQGIRILKAVFHTLPNYFMYSWCQFFHGLYSLSLRCYFYNSTLKERSTTCRIWWRCCRAQAATSVHGLR